MTTVAIIPARGGSKGIKNKNIIDLVGKPLIAYVLEALVAAKEVDHIAVTSDSQQILNIVREIDRSVIGIKRPDKLSGDTCTSETALLHAISILEDQDLCFDHVLFAQATSPLTKSTDFDNLLQNLKGHDSAAFYVDDYGFFFDLDDMSQPRMPRQSRTPRKREAGNAWAFSKNGFKESASRLFGRIALCRLDQPKEIEIDDLADLYITESILLSAQMLNSTTDDR